jgi:CheY-like chemotaxis protein
MNEATPPFRILLADDEPLVLEVIEEFLTGEGHRVTATSNGGDALAKFRPGAFDLLVTDRAMPGMTGDQLAGRIKELDPGLPVILLTGFGEMIKSQGEIPGGVDLVLEKPISPFALLDAIERIMNRSASDSAAD